MELHVNKAEMNLLLEAINVAITTEDHDAVMAILDDSVRHHEERANQFRQLHDDLRSQMEAQ